jgi:hypothetical protein
VTTSRATKAWSLVEKTDLLEIKGHLYKPVKIKAKKAGDLAVTLVDQNDGKEYTVRVDPKHGVDVVELVKEPKRVPWKKPQDKAEEAVVDILGGVLVAVQPGKDELYVVPNLDMSTIAGHLFTFHGITGVDVKKPGGWDEALAVHRTDHEKPLDQLHVPHRHDKDRPETQIGPRFV